MDPGGKVAVRRRSCPLLDFEVFSLVRRVQETGLQRAQVFLLQRGEEEVDNPQKFHL